jgi:plastocyanin
MSTLLPVALIVLLVVLARRPTRTARALRSLGRLLIWAVLALSLVIVAMLLATVVREASLLGRLTILGILVGVEVLWQVRKRAAGRAPQLVVRVDRIVFVTVFTAYASAAVAWLLLGLVPALAAAMPSFADLLREWGRGDGVVADMALQGARAARNSSSGVQVTLDYLFSALNIALATFLVVKVRGNRTANLLALGMVGTAVAFNLQSHAALLVLGGHLGGLTILWHDLGVHVLAGVAYVFALLLFPDGAIDRTRGPHLLALAAVFGLISFIAIPDHTSALVLLFGVLVPAAALVAQSRRFREAQSPELRQLFRLLRAAMGLSLAGALAVLTVTSVLKSRDERFTETTRDYELVAPAAGTYVFYCDPHIEHMKGTVTVRDPSSISDAVPIVSIRAHGGKFDKDHLDLVAGRTTVIRFTNTDGTAHNVSIYRDLARRDEVFAGQLFSGQDLATFTFRVFRFVFAIIPVALFVAILRFHLWDVDRLVNRAMVYSALTGILGLVYASGALLVGLLPGAVFNQRELVVVWILAAGLLIRPARRRLQTAIDRRFYREKLDTIRTLESFSVHVRDEIDLDELADQLVSVVSATMHPEYVSLWIRDGEGTPGRETSAGEPS